jgi:hypothetical protein
MCFNESEIFSIVMYEEANGLGLSDEFSGGFRKLARLLLRFIQNVNNIGLRIAIYSLASITLTCFE